MVLITTEFQFHFLFFSQLFGEEPGIPEIPQQNDGQENINEPIGNEENIDGLENNQVPVQNEPQPEVPREIPQPQPQIIWEDNVIANNHEAVENAEENNDDVDGGVPPPNIDGENVGLPEDDHAMHNAQGADDGGWNPDAIMEDLTWEKVI